MISSYVAKTLCVARFAHAFLGPNGSAIARRAFVERAHQAEPLQLYYLDCGAGLSLLEAHLEKYRFLRGTEVPSADDLVAREKVEAAGHNLEKYPFPRVRDWIERLRQTDATTTASGEVAVEFLEHSPVNLDYIKQLRSQEEQVALGSSWEFLGTLPGFSGHSGLRGMQQAPAPAASLEIS